MNKLAAFLTLIRWPNLLLLSFVQYSIFECLNVQLDNFSTFFAADLFELVQVVTDYAWFWIVMPASILIAAGGYIVNDIYDQQIDEINKPQKRIVGKIISVQASWWIYGLFNLTAFGWPLLFDKFSWPLELFFLAVIGVLWAYSRYLKQMPFWGNLCVAALAAASVLIIYADAWDIRPASWPLEYHQHANYDDFEQVNTSIYIAHLLFVSYAAFAFFSTLIREQIKDLEDRLGDQAAGANTMATRYSLQFNKFTIYVSSVLLAVLIAALGLLCWVNGYVLLSVYCYLLLFLGLMVLVNAIKISTEKWQFSLLSFWIKIYMLVGLGLLWLWYLIA